MTRRELWVWYTPFRQGGVETFLLSMARQARRAGAEFWIAATQDAQGPLRPAFEEHGARVLDWSGYHAAFMGQGPAAAVVRRIAADLVEARPSVVALNDCIGFSVGMAPLIGSIRRHAVVIDTLHLDSPDPLYFAARRHSDAQVDGIVSTNPSSLDKYRARFPGRPAAASVYVPNGVEAVEGPRAEHDGPLRLLYVGRLAQAQKRVLELPRLFDAMLAEGVDFQATLVGDGPERMELEREIATRGLASRVRLTGYLPPAGVRDAMLAHDILLNVSAFEGFPISVLEALSAGCVPMCTAYDGLDRGRLLDGVNCFLCPVDAIARMASTCRTLDRTTLRRMSENARKTGALLSDAAMYAGYREFTETLASSREFDPWPARFELRWSLTQDNPWIARPGRLRRLAQRLGARPARAEAAAEVSLP